MVGEPFEITLDLPRDPCAATVARRRLREELAGRLDSQQFTDLKVVVSELVTNAVLRGHGPIRLHIEVTGEGVRGEVSDGGAFECDVNAPGIDRFRGCGLLFVQRLTSRWGVRDGTTQVWFEMLSHAPAPLAHRFGG